MSELTATSFMKGLATGLIVGGVLGVIIKYNRDDVDKTTSVEVAKQEERAEIEKKAARNGLGNYVLNKETGKIEFDWKTEAEIEMDRYAKAMRTPSLLRLYGRPKTRDFIHNSYNLEF